MAKKTKTKPEQSWQLLRRAALDDLARRVLVDPGSSDELLEAAKAHLASGDLMQLAREKAPRLSVATLRAIRADLTGKPEPSYLTTTPASEPELVIEPEPTEPEQEIIRQPEPIKQAAPGPIRETTSASLPAHPAHDSREDARRLLDYSGSRRRYWRCG